MRFLKFAFKDFVRSLLSELESSGLGSECAAPPILLGQQQSETWRQHLRAVKKKWLEDGMSFCKRGVCNVSCTQ